MAETSRDFTTTVSDFVTTSLDNIKRFIDHTTEEVAKADVVGANRRIVDQVIEGTKETVTEVAECAAKNDPLAAVRHLATGTLRNTKETVRVASEESRRINLLETGAKVTQEGLDLLRRQVDLGFDVGSEFGQAVEGMLPFREAIPYGKRPGVVTRVEIESDKGPVKPEPAQAHTKK